MPLLIYLAENGYTNYMKIAFFELNDFEKEYFKTQIQNHELIFFDKPLKKEEISSLSDIEGLVVFIYSHVDKDVLDKLPGLKFISTMSTGFDHIDMVECKNRKIIVSNVSTYGEITVAEHAFALILAISRRIIESHERVREGKFTPEGLTGFDLFGKTLGVIGVGNIGSHVIRIAKGIGMEVLGYKRTPNPKLESDLGFHFTDMETLLAKSDIITLHVPYSKETHHMIAAEQFAKMKNGVVVINTARGALIDTDALVAALDSKKVAAAGLDVLEEEPMLQEEKALLSQEFDREALLHTLENHMLLNNKNVIITPHNAFNSNEALVRIVHTTKENIEGFANGTPKNVVSA